MTVLSLLWKCFSTVESGRVRTVLVVVVATTEVAFVKKKEKAVDGNCIVRR